MERLTKRKYGEIVSHKKENGGILCSNYCNNCSQGTGNCKYIKEMVNKLADYEDAEEQGLLVRIECRCKDCIYVDFAGCSNGTCYCLKHESYMQQDDFCKRAEKYKEEAEQKLKEMERE